ncbi:hypothetical protein CDL15_Pgr017746 [Punica granatum]|uniref:ABC transporter domain-containing protein n=2 Tax=Punica granatum TaxID=22663 RepID=A0A218WH31_PUNGR|nr:hypothetical protein CDL15_Pgr017746 [Punica granatum]
MPSKRRDRVEDVHDRENLRHLGQMMDRRDQRMDQRDQRMDRGNGEPEFDEEEEIVTVETERYRHTLESCSLVEDLNLLPYGDHTEIEERGVNLSGGQKQRIRLARALYQDADIYLLDDPFSAVDAHTTSSLFNDYVMGALSDKTVFLVTHQVNILPAFDFVLLMSDGKILQAAPFDHLLALSMEFQDLVHAHKETLWDYKKKKVAIRTMTIRERILSIQGRMMWRKKWQN